MKRILLLLISFMLIQPIALAQNKSDISKYISDLRTSKDDKTIVNAINMLGSLKAKEAVPDIARYLHHSNANIWATALFSLGNIGPAAKTAVPDIISTFDRCIDLIWPRKITEILIKIGPGGIPYIIEKLKDNNFQFRGGLVRALINVGLDSDKALSELNLLSESRIDAEYMVDELAKLPPHKNAVFLLSSTIKNNDIGVRKKSARLLGKYGAYSQNKVVQILSQALKDTDRDVRRAAVISLGELMPPAKNATGPLIGALNNDENEYFKTTILEAIAKIGITKDKDAMEIVKYLDDNDENVREKALEVLKTIKNKDIRKNLEDYRQKLEPYKQKPLSVNKSVNQQISEPIVLLKPSKDSEFKCDIYLKDAATGKEVYYMSIMDVSKNHYHSNEYHNGTLYVIRRLGNDGYYADGDWTDELWSYNKDGFARKIYADKGIDFRVSPDERYVVVRKSGKFVFINIANDTVVNEIDPKMFSGNEKLSGDAGAELLKWSSDSQYFWGALEDVEAPPDPIFKISIKDMNMQRYDIGSYFDEYDFNPDTAEIVFSDYPMICDHDSRVEFEESKAKVSLFVYNLETKNKQLIDTSIAKTFFPHWVNNNVIEYNNPQGEGRIKYDNIMGHKIESEK